MELSPLKFVLVPDQFSSSLGSFGLELEDEETAASPSYGGLGEGEDNPERQLRELGIRVGDDDFQTAEGAKAMLDA
ncbi:hypothetical protein ACOMHN_056236 [Nucella lapillus]